MKKTIILSIITAFIGINTSFAQVGEMNPEDCKFLNDTPMSVSVDKADKPGDVGGIKKSSGQSQ